MKTRIIIALLSICSLAWAQTIKPDFSKHFKNLPFKMAQLKVPSFPNKDFNIKKYGAVGDGITLNTNSFEKAIAECSKNGGGRVVVPAGIWLTGPIYFKSNVNLYLEKGAHIQFTKNFNDYPLIESNWEGINQYRCTSPLMGRKLKNIAITGEGIIDGAGEIWRPVKKSKMTDNEWKALLKSGGVVDSKGDTWWPSKEALEASVKVPAMRERGEVLTIDKTQIYKVYFRPVLLSFAECENVWLDGVTFQNSPAWNLHPLMCNNVIVSNVTVRNPWYSQNGDGIDIESCRNVLLVNSKFDVGDDGICIKSGKDEEGRKRGIPTENLIVSDCVVYHGHGGFTVGSEMSGGVKNVKVDNCNFIGTDVGLRFKSTRGRGGIVENIWISNIYMKDIPAEALSFNLFYGGVAATDEKPADEKAKDAKEMPVNEGTPSFRNIYLENIVCDGARDAVVIQGLPEMPVKNIEIKRMTVTAGRGVSLYDAEGIKLKDVKIISASPAVKINQSRNIELNGLGVKENSGTIIKIDGNRTSDIKLTGAGAAALESKTVVGTDVPKDAVKVK